MAMKHDPMYFAPSRRLGGGWVCHKDSPSPPPAPDYAGAARATAAGDAEAARIATSANRVDQYTPYGSLTYSRPNFNEQAYQDAMSKWGSTAWKNDKDKQLHRPDISSFGDPDSWSSNVSLSPAQQQLLDRQNQTSIGLSNLEDKGLGYVQNMLNSPFDESKLPSQAINPGQTAQDAILSRLEPTWNAKQAAMETQLANQGIAQGTEAYTNGMRDFNNARNDAEMQAALQGISAGQQARQQAFQEQSFLRNEPLNTLNAVRTGAQVTNPTFTNVPQQQTTRGADILGATQAEGNWNLGNYNSQVASNNSFNSGLMNLAGTAGMMFMMSDRRLKRNIVPIGKTAGGINVYSYDYVWGEPSIGVMADEVEHIPGAVAVHPSGYKMVDYSKVR